jgi:hypothetical protein
VPFGDPYAGPDWRPLTLQGQGGRVSGWRATWLGRRVILTGRLDVEVRKFAGGDFGGFVERYEDRGGESAGGEAISNEVLRSVLNEVMPS